MLETGTVLDGKYRILSEIGRGGMSVVYLALNDRANKTWAVKEVRRDGGAGSPALRQGLAAETEMLKKLKHPNLPAVVDVIDRDDSLIIVMDYIEGRSLEDVLKSCGAQDQDTVAGWAMQLADVLGYLHSRQPAIIYRDMKPANVMLRPDNQVALIDFGTAREYKSASPGDTAWLGTRGYAAPEQFGGRGQTDARTDIYCLGATMYHLLTGYSPADTQFVIYPVGRLRPELSGSGIEKIVARCCEPDPADRYQSCAELMYALSHVRDEDDAARRSRSVKWAAFLAAGFISLAGMTGMVFCRHMESTVRRQSYEALLSEAAAFRDSLDQMSELYLCAMTLAPGREEAYSEMLDNLVRNEIRDGAGNEITDAERQRFKECLSASPASRGDGRGNLTLLKVRNPGGHDRLVYRMGLYYFTYCSNAKQDAYQCMSEIGESTYLTGHQPKIRDSVKLLSDYYVNLSRGRASFADYDAYNYLDLWRKLYALTSEPDTIAERTGGDVFALYIYRETLTQISSRVAVYSEEGVSGEEMERVVAAARDFASLYRGSQSDLVRRFAEQTLAAADRAEDAAAAQFGKDAESDRRDL
ncbi:MAG: serine/threonine protein kinase [Lachnospiraceae bacterium]|nr:serine/threonine protein kinase [Lachnospiraceae bacterium]